MSRIFTAASGHLLSVSAAAVAATPLSIACWFRVNDVTTRRTLVSLCDGSSDNRWWNLELRGDVAGDFLGARVRATGGDVAAVTSLAYTANTWYHACGVFTSSTSRTCYINGANSGSETTSADPSASITTTVIGNRSSLSSGALMDGRISHVTIFNVALKAAEVAALSAGVSPWRVRPEAIVGFWRCGVSSPEPDWSGKKNNMTVTGATIGDGPPVGPLF